MSMSFVDTFCAVWEHGGGEALGDGDKDVGPHQVGVGACARDRHQRVCQPLQAMKQLEPDGATMCMAALMTC